MSASLVERLQNEADQCRNDGAHDIAAILDAAVSQLLAKDKTIADYKKLADDYSAALDKAIEFARQQTSIAAALNADLASAEKVLA